MILLRPYQSDISIRAAEILRRHGVCLLLMQLRTGKTLTSLATASLMNAKKVLFVTKKKVIDNILNDSEQLGVDYHLTVTNYEQLSKLKPIYDLIITDEFHCTGAFPKPSERTKALKLLCKNVPIIMLSGTPTPESYSQLFHPLWCVDFWPHKNFYAWAKDYVTVKQKFFFNRAINDYSNADGERIKKIIEPITIHYTQAQAGFDIVVEDRIEIIPMPDIVRTSLKILKRDKIIKTKSGDVILADTAVKLMGKTHQICSGTVKTESGNIIAFDDFKAKYIKEKYAGYKIAIYYKYIGERECLDKHFKNVALTDKEFNESGPDKVYLSQIQSGREGINLSSADYIIMYNIDYSSLSYIQVRERLNVKGRVKPGVVVWVFTDGGIEEKIYKLVGNKQDYTLSHFLHSRLETVK